MCKEDACTTDEVARRLLDLDRSSSHWRYIAQNILYDDIRSRSGADFYTPFFIRSTDANRDLWLVHLAQHPRARDEMAEQHWDVATHASHYGRPGLNMLGFHPGAVQLDLEARLPGFEFDTLAETTTTSALIAEVPEQIKKLGGRTSYKGLFRATVNNTPATSRIFRDALARLR